MNARVSLEQDLAALEAHYQGLIADAKHIREHVRHCEYSDPRTVEGFDRLLCALGIYDKVTQVEDITQPAGEMAATTGD